MFFEVRFHSYCTSARTLKFSHCHGCSISPILRFVEYEGELEGERFYESDA